jgi:hypothetical protein
VVNTTPSRQRIHKDAQLQRNAAPPHSALTMQDILNDLFQAAGLAIVHQYLMHHYPGHDTILILKH